MSLKSKYITKMFYKNGHISRILHLFDIMAMLPTSTLYIGFFFHLNLPSEYLREFFIAI